MICERIGRIRQNSDPPDGRYDLANDFEGLGTEFGGRRGRTGDVAVRPSKAGNETSSDRIAGVLCRRPDHRGGRRADSLNAGTGLGING